MLQQQQDEKQAAEQQSVQRERADAASRTPLSPSLPSTLNLRFDAGSQNSVELKCSCGLTVGADLKAEAIINSFIGIVYSMK